MDIVKDTKIVMLPIGQLANNDGQIAGVPKNPRVISDERYRALVRRLKKSNLTGVIPLKVYEQDGVFVVLSGNQRLKALRQLKAAEVPCIIVPKGADAETLREIVVLENVNDGEWDGLENWNADELQEWGVTMPWSADPEDTPNVKDPENSELNTDGFQDKIKMTLEFTIEEHAFVQQALASEGQTKEQTLLQVLGYEQ